jgi:hypothetical protein
LIPGLLIGMAAVRLACGEARCDHGYKALCSDSLEIKILGNYTVAILATIGLVIVFTVPVVWQFLQPNDDDFGDISKKPKQ